MQPARWTGVAGAAAVLALGVGLSATPHPAATPAEAPAAAAAPAAATVRLPPANGQLDYQLGGAYRPASTVAVLVRDRTAAPVAGTYGVCYVNGFQTQAQEKRWWTSKHPDLLLRTATGRLVQDPDWPGEYLLDSSTASRRRAIAGVMGTWFRGCAAKGFQGVEADNLDSWTRSGRRLTRAHNQALATLLTQRAHAEGLAIAQKNAAELAPVGRSQLGFDFAIAEECQVYDECGAYTATYGRQVYEVEYTDNDLAAYRTACQERGATTSVVLRDRDLVRAGDPGYVYKHC